MERLARNGAKVTSYLMHPLLVTSYIFAIIIFDYPYLTIPNVLYKFYLLIVIFCFTYLIPAIAVYVMYKMDIITELTLEENRQRRIPYLVTSMIYFFSYLTFKNQGVDLIPDIILIITLSMIFVTIISLFWKISAHSVGVGGLCGIAFWIHFTSQFDYTLLICGCILLSGIVMTARLYLKVHTQLQVYAGFVLGLLISLFGYPSLS